MGLGRSPTWPGRNQVKMVQGGLGGGGVFHVAYYNWPREAVGVRQKVFSGARPKTDRGRYRSSDLDRTALSSQRGRPGGLPFSSSVTDN